MPQTPHVEQHFTASEYVRDIVIGMSDGLTVPFALAAGLSGAVESSGINRIPSLLCLHFTSRQCCLSRSVPRILPGSQKTRPPRQIRFGLQCGMNK